VTAFDNLQVHKSFMPPFRRILSAASHALLFGLPVLRLEASPYTYIDASPSNTTLDGAPLVAGTNYINDGTSGSGTDNFWTLRSDTGFAAYEQGNAFESDSGDDGGVDRETTSPLVTTITLPSVGTYEIVVVFAQNTGRDIAARIGSAPTASNIFSSANFLSVNQSNNPQVVFDNTYANGRAANHGAGHLGQITTTVANQAVPIFINGLARNASNDEERTQYEGIGYRVYEKPPPPEPKHRDVFLIAGQSNADGRGLKSELTGGLATYAGEQPGVLIHYTNTAYTNADRSRYGKWMVLEPGFSVAPGYRGALPSTTFGMEIGAAKVLSNTYPNPAFIKATRGGTALGVPGTDWYPAPLDSPAAGPLYKTFIESTRLALAELTAAGDTHTVHALFWHQGESDSTRTAEYGALLTTLIESVRRDLAMPNLRFVIGELSPTKPQDFRNVQWQVARGVPNAGFISTRGFSTSDGTHFTASSMVTFGERLGHALLPGRDTLDFEIPTCAPGALDRQDEFAATDGLASALQVAAAAVQGEYSAGQAAGHVGAGGAHFFTRRNLLPLSAARSMQADFFPGDAGYDNEADADSSLLVAGWGADAGSDGLFNEAESAIGLGLHHTGAFRIQIGATTYLSGSGYQIDRWYRLTLGWSEPDASGNRAVSLFARDLAGGTDLNGGQPVITLENITPAQFDGCPARWSGLGCRSTRGLVDNIRITPPGFAAWMETLYPSLIGGTGDDDDNDSLENTIEFAFGLNPLRPDPSSALPQPVYGPFSATVTFAPPATQPGILYQLDWSRDLTDWTTVNGSRIGGLLEFTIPTAGETALFLRHRVVVNE
jgi:hypothetical protein